MRSNEIIEKRMEGFYKILSGAYESGDALSSSTKGNEREFFLTSFLEAIFPPTYRFGTGDIVDSNGKRSGQLDVVVEYPFLPSFPVFGKDSPRLYLADGVAIAIEVKSSVSKQWEDVVVTANKLSELSRDESRIHQAIGGTPGIKIPLIAVGFSGWKTIEAVEENLLSSSVEAVLCIDSKIFSNKPIVNKHDKAEVLIQGGVYQGNQSLWEFAKYFYNRVGSVATMRVDIDAY